MSPKAHGEGATHGDGYAAQSVSCPRCRVDALNSTMGPSPTAGILACKKCGYRTYEASARAHSDLLVRLTEMNPLGSL